MFYKNIEFIEDLGMYFMILWEVEIREDIESYGY